MLKVRHNLLISVTAAALILISACAPVAKTNSPVDNSMAASTSTDVALVPATQVSSDSPADNFPKTPDPITVKITLDTKQTASGSSYDFPFSIKGKTADASEFDMTLDNKLYTQNADGNMTSAFGTVVTITPVSAIEGLPFSQGFLAAVQLGPEGLFLAEPGKLTLNVPGNVEKADLIGFASDGNGGNFHMFPVTGSYSDYYGATQFLFNVMHFSVYGIAKVSAGEMDSLAAHPPSSSASQDENELAPLVPVLYDNLAPLLSNLQLQLIKSHDRFVKPAIDSLAAAKCEQVATAAYLFNEWRSKVDLAYQTDYFQAQIDSDGKALHDRFIECGKEFCPVCMTGQSGAKADQAKINSLITMATFAEDLSFNLGYDDFAFWRQLSSVCAATAGIQSPSGSTGGDTSGDTPAATPTPFGCPV